MSNPPFLRPFFSYYGSKWSRTLLYPKPEFSVIYEWFAGGAAYSCRYYRHRVVLVDSFKPVTDVWQYLRRAKRQQILNLPSDIVYGKNINDVYPELEQAERYWMGFCLDKGNAFPRGMPSKWLFEHPNDFFWPQAKIRGAEQVQHIRHWEIRHADYREVEELRYSTIFIDPPYQHHGRNYARDKIDYDELGYRIRGLHPTNQIIACEGDGATYLPFELLSPGRRPAHKSGGKSTNEFYYYRSGRDRQPAIGRGFDLAPPQKEEIDMKMTQAAEIKALMGNETLDLMAITNRLKRKHPKVANKKLYHSARAVLCRNSEHFERVSSGVYRVISPGATPTANGNGGAPQKWETKAAFIRAHLHLAPPDVVELGKTYGIKLPLQTVYTVRSAARIAGVDVEVKPSVALARMTEAVVVAESRDVPTFDEWLLRIVDAAWNTEMARERLDVVRERVQVLTRARVEMMMQETAKKEVEAFFSNL